MTETRSDDERRIAELFRVNQELAAELRSVTMGRTSSPRRASLPASREIAKLRGQRDDLRERLTSAEAELERHAEQRKAWDVHRDELESVNQQLSTEMNRLRSGLSGLVLRSLAALNRKN